MFFLLSHISILSFIALFFCHPYEGNKSVLYLAYNSNKNIVKINENKNIYK